MMPKRSPLPGSRIDAGEPVFHRRGRQSIDTQQLSFADLGPNLADVTFIVVDVETTGEKPGLHALTEIGAVKICGGEIIEEFSSLINPGVPIPAFISRLTGITNSMVATAPSLSQVLSSFIAFVGSDPDLVFVAHNASFDIGQLVGASQALDIVFPHRKVVDTVKLSRRVFTRDEVPNYKLSSLARFVHATTSPSHRALDDARATVDVFHAVLARLGSLGVTHLEDLLTAHSQVPHSRRLKAQLADHLPSKPGVYSFIGPHNEVLYVGTSANVYKRVRNYFTAGEKRRRIGEMVDLATRVEAKIAATVIEAQILEIRMINDIAPPYNKRSKPRTRYWIALTDEPHPRLKITRQASLDSLGDVLGPFTRMSQARASAELIQSLTGIRSCTQQLKNSAANATACHLQSLQLCDAPCITGYVQQEAIEQTRSILSGHLDTIYHQALAKMRKLAGDEKFESALRERERLYALVGAAKNQALVNPLIKAGRIIAGAPEKTRTDHWEVIVVDYGQLRTSTVIHGAHNVHRFIHEAQEEFPILPAPIHPFDQVTTDELRCLSAWLWRDSVRLVYVGSPQALTVENGHGQKIMLPDIPGIDQTMQEA